MQNGELPSMCEADGMMEALVGETRIEHSKLQEYDRIPANFSPHFNRQRF